MVYPLDWNMLSLAVLLKPVLFLLIFHPFPQKLQALKPIFVYICITSSISDLKQPGFSGMHSSPELCSQLKHPETSRVPGQCSYKSCLVETLQKLVSTSFPLTYLQKSLTKASLKGKKFVCAQTVLEWTLCYFGKTHRQERKVT